MAKYRNLKNFVEAYKAGKITNSDGTKCLMMVDNDEMVMFDDQDNEIFCCGGPHEIIYALWDILGIESESA